MKASAFLKLVEEVLTRQQDYFKAKRMGDPRQKDLLIASKELEKRAWSVIKQGSLEPDEPTPVLDSVASQRPNEQNPLSEGE